MSSTISIRATPEILNRLNAVASETERSKSYHILKAIEYYLEEHADLQIALDRLHDTGDEVISSQKMRKNLGL